MNLAVTLYEGSKLSIGRSCLLIAQFYRKYGLPRIAVNDLLTLIALHCPEKIEHSLPRSRQELIRKVRPLQHKFKKQKLCSVYNKAIENTAAECEDGHTQTAGKPSHGDTFFLYIPLEPQLRMLIEGKFCYIV